MSDPKQRPGFARVSTDMAVGTELQSYDEGSKKTAISSGVETAGSDTKTGKVSHDGKEIPPYQSSEEYSVHGGVVGDYVAGEHKIVETAEDIVNQVLTVEDDPTLNPWTFRMFFL